MKSSLWQESFIPVMIVFLAIFVGLLYVKYEVNLESEQVIVINIPSSSQDAADIEEQASGIEDSMDISASMQSAYSDILALMDAKKWKQAEQALQKSLATQETSEVWLLLG
ncbi:MAG: hypothetical protein Q9M44_03420, partial [Ghiorsea sp.]|nr:hypothetical protein [Ghiorsea sp.]